MTACDTNILFPALEASHADHQAARAFLESMVGDPTFALCELVLMEVYTLLRNPAICARPLSARDAVRKVENLRHNPGTAKKIKSPKPAENHNEYKLTITVSLHAFA